MIRALLRGDSWPAQASFAAVAATVMVIVAFPTVIFLGGSLAPSNIAVVIARSAIQDPMNFYWSGDSKSQPNDGFADSAAPVEQWEAAVRSLRNTVERGESPFWNPWVASGALGPETLVDIKLSPISWLIALLGAGPLAFTAVIVLGVWLAAASFILVCLRHLDVRRSSAAGGAIVIALGGFAVSYLGSQMAAPYVIFPGLLLLMLEYQRFGGVGRAIGAIFAYATLVLTTFLPTALITAGAVHVLAPAIGRDAEGGWEFPRLARRHGLVVVGALGVSAFVVVPVAAHLILGSPDVSQYSSRSFGHSAPSQYLTLLSPRHLWDIRAKRTWPFDAGWISYLGLVPVATAALGVLTRGRHRRTWWTSAAFLVAGIAFELQTPFLRLPSTVRPLSFIRPAYWGALVAIALALLVVFGLERLRSDGGNRPLLAGVGVGSWIILAVSLRYGQPTQEMAPGTDLLVAGMLVTSVLGIALLVPRLASPAVVSWLIVGLLTIEMVSYMNHVRTPRVDVLDPPPAYVGFLRENVGHDRILSFGKTTIYPDWGSATRLRQLGTQTTGQIPAYRAWFKSNIEERGGLFLRITHNQNPVAEIDERSLDVAGVRYLVVNANLRPWVDRLTEEGYEEVFYDREPRVRIYSNPDVLPRARVHFGLVHEDAKDDGGTSARTSDAGLLERAKENGIPTHTDRPPVAVRFERDDPTKVVLGVDSEAPGVLVLADTWHHNWSAEVDGERVKIHKAEGPFRAVPVPRGRSTVVFEYVSTPVTLGAWLSGISLLALVVFGAKARWRDPRP